jgi:hypothetical protein
VVSLLSDRTSPVVDATHQTSGASWAWRRLLRCWPCRSWGRGTSAARSSARGRVGRTATTAASSSRPSRRRQDAAHPKRNPPVATKTVGSGSSVKSPASTWRQCTAQGPPSLDVEGREETGLTAHEDGKAAVGSSHGLWGRSRGQLRSLPSTEARKSVSRRGRPQQHWFDRVSQVVDGCCLARSNDR